MTERPPSITTQNAIPTPPASRTAPPISTNDALPVIESADDEPYTIKCICEYFDDDGNTIYCEKCETWQHIECFYPGQVEEASRSDFQHLCADCHPRPLDRRNATERQRFQRQNKTLNDANDKKSKRPPSKSHKKKSKPSELQVNGHHDHDSHKNGSPQDHHPNPKKVKGHRSNQSINSQVKRSPPLNSRPHNHHPPSPAHTPPDLPNNFQVHGYSESFTSLYHNDQTVHTSTNNSFASLSVTNSMSLWLRDPERLKRDVGKSKDDIFQYLKVPVSTLDWPDLRIDEKASVINDTTIRWRSLITPTPVPEIIGELNGLVGFQKDYCADPENRWQETAHPRPFVFFHQHLPLFIDTRLEGSVCRYVRRSCRPNANLETFIVEGQEYHFWLTSEHPLSANAQITIPWDFRFPLQYVSRYRHLLNLGEEDGLPFDGSDINDEEYEQLSQIIYLVLSDHGGCACDLGTECAFARFHRNWHGRSQPQLNGGNNSANGSKPKKGRKPKQNHVSPTSTGQATNSRAASEGQGEPYDEDDNRSVSGSSRSKPHSRDLTPSHGLSESNGMFIGPSDREKRKLAMVEDSFRKMEQGPSRKKKRVSDGTNVNLQNSTTQSTPKPRQKSIAPRPSISQPSTTNGSRGRYVDASTSRRQSDSPFSAMSPAAAMPSPEKAASQSGSTQYPSRHNSSTPKVVYTDASTQTDEVENAWWLSPAPKTKRTVVPLAKRLLRNRHKTQSQQDLRASQATIAKEVEDLRLQTSPTVSMDLDVPLQDETHPESPSDIHGRKASIASSTPSADVPASSMDVNMIDAPAITIGNTIKPPPPPWPGQTHTPPILNASGPKSPELRVEMPPRPSFSTPNMSGPLSGTVTPSSATSSALQSPFGTNHFPPTPGINGLGLAAQSPVKTTKKLSLSDYKAARMKRTDTSVANKGTSGTSPTVTPAVLKPSLSTIEEAKSHVLLEGSAIVDSPAAEKLSNPITAAIFSTSEATSKD